MNGREGLAGKDRWVKAQGVTWGQVSLQKTNAAPWPQCPNLREMLCSLYEPRRCTGAWRRDGQARSRCCMCSAGKTAAPFLPSRPEAPH